MVDVDRFRGEHARLLAAGRSLYALLSLETLGSRPGEARTALAGFLADLDAHAAGEAEVYPALLEHEVPAVREQARALWDEVGELYGRFGAHSAAWPAEAIARDPGGFARSTKELLGALGQRMARENAELYPLVAEHLAGITEPRIALPP